jgi:hypothetical protein
MSDTQSHERYESRLSRNEALVSTLQDSFKKHQDYVHEKFEGLEKSAKASERRILDSLNSLTRDYSQGKSVSWPLVGSGVALAFGVFTFFMKWSNDQATLSAVNAKTAAIHHDYQAENNARMVDWNRRIVDRSLHEHHAVSDDLEAIRAGYYEHREGRELETRVDDLLAEIRGLETDLKGTETLLLESNKAYDHQGTIALDNAKQVSNLLARVATLEERIRDNQPMILETVNQLGKLEPLIKGMGNMETEGLRQKLLVLEKLIDNIDNKGSRVWRNDNPVGR